MSKKSKEEKLKEAEAKQANADIDRINKLCKTSFVTFDDSPLSDIQWINTGFPELNEVLSDAEDGGYARGRIIEIFGPEGGGKTWMLSQLYAQCARLGLKACHYDAEGTYHKKFALLSGVDPGKLYLSIEDKAEKIFEELESLCIENVFDVIGVDSFSSLVPMLMASADMGAQNYGQLAACAARCIPRLSSALKRSKTVLIFINQLRDNVGERYGPAEKTTGGRTLKFYASIRLDVRRKSIERSSRPELFDATGRAIGHVLAVKCVKNKLGPPFKVCLLDLMYQKPRPIIQVIKDAIETDVIARQRNSKNELWGKKLTYKDQTLNPVVKEDYEEVLTWLKLAGYICDLLVEMGKDDFDEYVASGDLTEEEVATFLAREVEACVSSAEETLKVEEKLKKEKAEAS